MTATTSFADPLMRLNVAQAKERVWRLNLQPGERIVGAGCHYFRSTKEQARGRKFIQTDEETGDGLVALFWVAIDIGEIVIDPTISEAIDPGTYAEFMGQMRTALDATDSTSALSELAQDSCRFCPEYTYEEPERDSWSDGQGGVDDE